MWVGGDRSGKLSNADQEIRGKEERVLTTDPKELLVVKNLL
jgi:hypothetical protein